MWEGSGSPTRKVVPLLPNGNPVFTRHTNTSQGLVPTPIRVTEHTHTSAWSATFLKAWVPSGMSVCTRTAETGVGGNRLQRYHHYNHCCFKNIHWRDRLLLSTKKQQVWPDIANYWACMCTTACGDLFPCISHLHVCFTANSAPSTTAGLDLPRLYTGDIGKALTQFPPIIPLQGRSVRATTRRTVDPIWKVSPIMMAFHAAGIPRRPSIAWVISPCKFLRLAAA